jgi:hypothetical protein
MRRLILLLALTLCHLPALAADEEADEKWDVNALPGEARSVAIDVSSGTWMSLDVSPDGRSIAFDLLGDIYLLPIAGGDARSPSSATPAAATMSGSCAPTAAMPGS